MPKSKNNKYSRNKAIKRILLKNNSNVPQEAFYNSMTIIKNGVLFRPNNYRRAITVFYDRNSTIKKLNSTIGFISNLNVSTHNKLINFRYKGLTFQLGKKTLTAIYSQNTTEEKKITYHIQRTSINEICQAITDKTEEIKQEIDIKLKEVANLLNIGLYGVIEWKRYEDWIKGEEFIDNIPRDTIIHDTHFKKVYQEGVEFIKSKEENLDPGVKIKNYLKNRALEEIAPDIAKAIKGIVKTQKNQIDILNNEALKPLTAQIKLHLKVQRETLKTLKKMQQTMDKKPLFKRIIERFKL